MKVISKLPRTAGALALAAVVGCGNGDDGDDGAPPADGPLFATASIVFSDEGDSSYVSLLSGLETQEVSLDDAIEMPGWVDLGASGGKLFLADGEAPTMRRYVVDANHDLTEDGAVSFLNYGAAYAGSGFVDGDTAYLFAETGVVWSPDAMGVTTTFPPAARAGGSAAGLEYGGYSTGRSFATHGNLAYLATHWANWDSYTVSEDSLIVVFDTTTNQVVSSIAAPCPYLDVATVADDGTVYFSNWVYSVAQTLVGGKRKACAVRILPGQTTLDPSWTLTFADVTDGREGAALQYIGGNRALFATFHHERVEDLPAQTDYSELTDSPNWKFWTIDLETRVAAPIEQIDFNAGGFYSARVDGRFFVMVPGEGYASTTFHEVLADGTAVARWSVSGWSLQLVKIR